MTHLSSIDRRCVLLSGAGFTATMALAACSNRGTDPNSLVVWQTESDENAVDVLNRIAADMKRENPALDITIETIGWGALSERMTGAIQTGEVPDLAHVQPFMLTSLQTEGHLLPLDDVARDIEFRNAAYPSLVELAERRGEIYGLPYAVGTTFWSYRADIFRRLGIAPPTTWAEVIDAVRQVHQRGTAADRQLFVLLPGASPFFLDQLFAEMLANNGGRLFNPTTGDPDLNTPAFQDVLRFFIDLRASGALDPDWASQTYQDQFARFPDATALMAPVTYARAAKAIERRRDELVQGGRDPSTIPSTPNEVGALDQPRGPRYSAPPIATIDAETFVLFTTARARGRVELARQFLRRFYDRANYLEFVSEVPIHLTPVQRDLRHDPGYAENGIVQRWAPWQQQTDRYLNGADGREVRPILMPGTDDRALQYLFQLNNERILSTAVQGALTAPADADPAQTAAALALGAHCKAVRLIREVHGSVSPTASAGCPT